MMDMICINIIDEMYMSHSGPGVAVAVYMIVCLSIVTCSHGAYMKVHHCMYMAVILR